MNNEIVIKIEQLNKTFSGIEVIKDCDMEVRKGSIYGFLGRNGAGKTTVFKLLTGLLKATSGFIKVFGMDITTDTHLILKEVGMLIETPHFYEHLSAIENLEIHMNYMNKVVDEQILKNTLTLVGLNNSVQKPVSTFSLGMRQRLAIARAIIHKPKLLILDEPFNGLDPIGIREISDLFTSLVKEEGITIILSSHNLNEVDLIADTIGVIAEGNIVNEEELLNVKNNYSGKLEDYFFSLMKGETIHV